MKWAGIACMVLVFVLQAVAAQAKSLELDHAVLEGRGLHLPVEVSSGGIRNRPKRVLTCGNRVAEILRHQVRDTAPGILGPSFELSYHLNVGLAPRRFRVLWPGTFREPAAFRVRSSRCSRLFSLMGFPVAIVLLATTVGLLFTSSRPVIPLVTHRISGADQ